MQQFDACLTLPPNLARKTISDMSAQFPRFKAAPVQTHEEMLSFARNFGKDAPPALASSAYPSFIRNALRMGEEGLLKNLTELDLPPMREDLADLGLAEPSSFVKVLAVIPFILIQHVDVSPPLQDWSDLCRPDIANSVAVPPEDTPLPEVFDTLMRHFCGDAAETVIAAKNTEFMLLDINKNIDAGNFRAGVNIPPFSRTFRNGGGRMIWPRSGAWAVPLVMTMSADAPTEAEQALSYLFSTEYQTYISQTALLVPVHPQAPMLEDMTTPETKLFWPGWKALCDLDCIPELG